MKNSLLQNKLKVFCFTHTKIRLQNLNATTNEHISSYKTRLQQKIINISLLVDQHPQSDKIILGNNGDNISSMNINTLNFSLCFALSHSIIDKF